MEEIIKELIKKILKILEIKVENFNVEHPENLENGDYSTNVAMICAKNQKLNPRDLAEKIKIELEKKLPKEINKVEIAGAGFINFYLSQEFFSGKIREILEQKENWGKNNLFQSKRVMVEYTQPNPFKPFHIGHLMSNAIGESISRLVEFSGVKVVRANYQGDVGPHVAKAIYVMIQNEKNTLSVGAENVSLAEKSEYIGKCYSEGSNLYDSDEKIKKEIEEINKKIYDRSDKKINEIYDWGRKVTLEAFEEIYKLLDTKFDKYYFESEVVDIGKKIVWQNFGEAGSIFEESDPDPEQVRYGAGRAIIFRGEKYDPKLHTRVFINSQNLPTYETKELGLTFKKFEKKLFKKNLDLSLVITANEQVEYMKVVQKAISILFPNLEKKMKHISHGMMRFSEGKMSSRLGNVITGKSLLENTEKVIQEKIKEKEFLEEEKKQIAEIISVGALKYSILKSSTSSDIIFDFEKSISFDGSSGPYLQYTAVRANSILEKASLEKINLATWSPNEEETLEIEKILYRFPEIVWRSQKEYEPHYLATYLIELASAFNSFYGNTKIIDKNNSNISYHLALVKAFYQTMKNGLWLLGIKVPSRM